MNLPPCLIRQLRSPSPRWKPSLVFGLFRGQRQLPVRFASSQAHPEKPYYITTPIFYVNAAPHVGHLYTMVLTDILKRWQVLKGKKAIMCTGTDEHGMKIQRAAEQAGIDPKEFCDSTAETFKKLAASAGISNDYFVRTTDADHIDAVQYFWFMLMEREYIYETKHEGWYCVSDETFYPESSLEKRVDPATGRTILTSQETGKEVEWTSEVNYHFRLSAMKDRLLEFYKANPKFVVPAARMDDVIKWVTEGLQDLSISRPVERLSWGIRVPEDPNQTIYVWLDALVNYITKAGYPWAPGQEHALGWPADVQVIGKDIVRFHCIYWPAFLLALEIEPPKQILTHAHWTLSHQKMAKSTGNVVNPFFAIDRFGVDTMRYYLAHDGGILNDSDYGNQYIIERYKKGLSGGLGNLLSRITRPKVWNVSHIIQTKSEWSKLPGKDQETVLHTQMLQKVAEEADTQIMHLNPGSALQTIMEVVYETNKYLQKREPWQIAKLVKTAPDTASAEQLQSHISHTIYNCTEAMRIVGILLQPYMPGKAAELLDRLGVDESMRKFEHAKYGIDLSYGNAKIAPGSGPWEGLFPPLVNDDAATFSKLAK